MGDFEVNTIGLLEKTAFSMPEVSKYKNKKKTAFAGSFVCGACGRFDLRPPGPWPGTYPAELRTRNKLCEDSTPDRLVCRQVSIHARSVE